MRLFLLSIPLLGLLFAIGMQVFDAVRPQPAPSITQPLAELINPEMPGWKAEDLPLAETEEMLARVDEILDFDDYVSRIYTRGNTQLILYVAYWKPGSAPIKQAHEHTPDICWVGNGWTSIKREHQIDLDKVFVADAHPAEFRVFEKQGQTQSVTFWHIVGDQIYANEQSRYGQISGNFLKTLTQFGINQKREQFFVRISSNRDIRDLLKDPSTLPLLQDLAKKAKITPHA
ncbi:MAG: exosortase-associated EpsI family protein [Opitutales bacterium]